MRIIHKSTPPTPSVVPEPAQTSLGRHLLGAVTGGPDRKSPGLHSPPGIPTSPSLLLNKRLVFPIVAILAALAVGLLFLLPDGLLHAQDADGPITYAENGTGAVATFTATDPEGESITWSVSGGDMEHFALENGVLRFKSSPDFEMAADDDTDNTYEVTIVASDGGEDTTAMKEVTVEVTNVDEDGTVTLSTLQPQVG